MLHVWVFFSGQLDPVQQAKHSPSAVEVTACFSQVREIWLQLAWPDSAGAFIFITRLTDVSPTRKKAHRETFFLPVLQSKPKKESEKTSLITGLVFYLSKNFCSEAVCYSEMITRKIERSQLGRDHKSFTVQVTPVARPDLGGHMMTWEVNVSTCSPRQHKGLSRRSDMFTLYTERNQLPLVVVNHSHWRPVPPLLCSPASFPSLFLHLHPLFLLFCSSSLFC